jgi:hypothetical protein
MTRFYGRVGYGESVETAPGVWIDQIEERSYYGDVVRNTRNLREGEQLNFDLSVNNSISIVADAYANEHFFAIRYVEWAGTLWTVSQVEVQSPRLLLRLGEVYNGPTPGIVSGVLDDFDRPDETPASGWTGSMGVRGNSLAVVNSGYDSAYWTGDTWVDQTFRVYVETFDPSTSHFQIMLRSNGTDTEYYIDLMPGEMAFRKKIDNVDSIMDGYFVAEEYENIQGGGYIQFAVHENLLTAEIKTADNTVHSYGPVTDNDIVEAGYGRILSDGVLTRFSRVEIGGGA